MKREREKERETEEGKWLQVSSLLKLVTFPPADYVFVHVYVSADACRSTHLPELLYVCVCAHASDWGQ